MNRVHWQGMIADESLPREEIEAGISMKLSQLESTLSDLGESEIVNNQTMWMICSQVKDIENLFHAMTENKYRATT